MKILCENKSLKFEKNLAPNSGETRKKERKDEDNVQKNVLVRV